MADEISNDELPPEKPALKMSVTGCLVALGGVAIMGVLVGLVLRWWG
jgi:hypothetical protein